MRKLILIIVISFVGLSLEAQTNLDSLWSVWNDETKQDTTRLKAMQKIAWDGYLFSQPDSGFYFAQMQYDLAEKSGLKKHMSVALNTQGASFWIRGDYPKALDHYQRSLKIYEEIGSKKGIASSLGNIGIIYQNQGDYPKALNYYQRSLKIMEEIGYKKGISNPLNNIGLIYADQGDYPKALDYYQRSLKIREEVGDKNGIANSLGNIGLIYKKQGDYPKALDYYKKSLTGMEEVGDKSGVARALVNIGTIYQSLGDYPKALDYYERSLKIREEIGDKNGISGSLNNIGLIYQSQGDYPIALDYLQRSLKMNEKIGDKKGIAGSLGNIGLIYQKQGDYPKGLDYYQRSLKIYEEIGYKNGVAYSLNSMGIIYQKQEHHQKAINQCSKGLLLAQESGEISVQRDACQCLYDTYKATGNGNKALEYHEQMLALDDSLNAEETSKKLQQMEFQKEMLQDSIAKAEETRLIEEAHQEEVRQGEKTRNIGFGVGFVFLLAAGGLYGRVRYIRKSKALLQSEKDRSENLLLNILPADIAAELKEKGKAEARDFDLVSILFTDFKGFTEQSAKMSAADLVNEISVCFEAFDGIMAKYGVEKIKTIGDAYMAAGGLPVPTDDSVKNTVLAGLKMQEFITARYKAQVASGLPAFEMRVGIHTGPVVAGIVGVKKFQYDIWGDTVNTASRMESAGEVGKVNISQATYELLKDDADFRFESRGKIEAKGKGEMEMYFVSKAYMKKKNGIQQNL